MPSHKLHRKHRIRLPIALLLGFALGLISIPSHAGTRKHTHSATNVGCATCHAAEAAEQPVTPMGSTLELPASNPVLLAHPKLTFRRGDYSYTVETTRGVTTYSVTDGRQTIALPVLWSVGARSQTWMVEFNGRLYESMVSYYNSIDGLAVTTADEVIQPNTLEQAIGRAETDSEKKMCFGCHTTNAIVDGQLNLASMQPGITCEHCHTGTLEHFNATQGKVAETSEDSTPPKLGKLNTEQLSNLCGQCHRTWEMIVRGGSRGTPNVRFQAYRIANSRCYDGTDPRIGCTACHNPHRDLVSNQDNPAWYDSKCLACHGPTAQNVASPQKESPKPCPVANSGCVSCHMPRTRILDGPAIFTDHQIRVVRPGDPYPN